MISMVCGCNDEVLSLFVAAFQKTLGHICHLLKTHSFILLAKSAAIIIVQQPKDKGSSASVLSVWRCGWICRLLIV